MSVRGRHEAARNPAQHAWFSGGIPRTPTKKPSLLPSVAVIGSRSQSEGIPPRGAELPLKTSGKMGVRAEVGAESGAVEDSRLTRVVEAWPRLSEAVRRKILSLARKASN